MHLSLLPDEGEDQLFLKFPVTLFDLIQAELHRKEAPCFPHCRAVTLSRTTHGLQLQSPPYLHLAQGRDYVNK